MQRLAVTGWIFPANHLATIVTEHTTTS